MGTLDGKSAVVTGGSRGIGRAIVERPARDGACVVFNYVASKDAAAEVETTVAAGGGTAVGMQADLGEAGAAERLMDVARERLGELDILVNWGGSGSRRMWRRWRRSWPGRTDVG